jgi:plasmid stabilization system protein ParE
VRVVCSPRAIRDLEHIAAYYRSVADPNIAAAISQRIQHVINRIAHRPQSAPPVVERRDVRAVLVLLSVQDFLSRARRCGRDSAHTPHRATGLGGRHGIILASHSVENPQGGARSRAVARGSIRPAFALRATPRQPSLASPRKSGLACRAVAREASEGWWAHKDSNLGPAD